MAALLAWYREHGRALVIRESRDPYAIWIGEVMSQQTQIGRVGEALPAFLARFPDVPALAGASTGDVIRAWGGLGYPRRAVALRDAAQAMVERHEGRVPDTLSELEALPGIGPYTGRAIAATAFGLPVTALDVNARRVLGRVAVGAPLPAAPGPALLASADALAPPRAAADWNHALMDLGASVCRPIPECSECPLRRWCAYASGHVVTRPVPDRRPGVRFADTDRYVRGRVLAVLRDAPDDTWSELDPDALAIASDRITRATQGLVMDGLIELREESDGRLVARLPRA